MLFELFPVPQTLRANTAKRQILSRANLVIVTVGTGKVFATTRTALKKNHFITQNCTDRLHDFFDVVVALDREGAMVTIIIKPQMH